MFKTLFIGCNRRYINPHTELLLPLLAGVGDLVCFGPGFVDEGTLSKGVSAFSDKHGPFDFVVTDSFVLEGRQLLKRKHPFHGSYINFEPGQYCEFVAEAESYFTETAIPKLFYQNLDLYHVQVDLIELLERSGSYVLGWGEEFQGPVADITSPVDDFARLANDNYYNFTRRNRQRFISLPFFVAESEVTYGSLDGRPRKLAIPGTGYADRKAAKRALRAETVLGQAVKKLIRLYLAMRRSSWTRTQMMLCRHQFACQIEDAKVCYVTGSCIRYLVRKYFEVPAKGCLLACAPANGLRAAGFRSGENCLVVDLNELVDYMDHGFAEDRAQEIAHRGRHLILEEHTLSRRIEQLREALRAIQAGTFKGSRWVDGKFEVLH